MATTMCSYTKKGFPNIAIVGVVHLHEKSAIYPILDKSSLEYIAVNIARHQ